MFAEYDFLLNKDKSDLATDIQNRIKALKLKHVGFKAK